MTKYFTHLYNGSCLLLLRGPQFSVWDGVTQLFHLPQELDVGSRLSLAYHDHLRTGSKYYVGLLQKLEVQYGITVADLDGSQLEGMGAQQQEDRHSKISSMEENSRIAV